MPASPTPRERFTTAVFLRDRGQCVVCGAPAVDAHHLMERRLFPDGGYDPDNGVAVCADHHLAAEETRISPDELRAAAGITRVVLPSQLSPDERYTKWGDIVLPNGTRIRGELFDEEPVQKVLARAGMLALYTHYVKQARTPHLPWSPGATADDMVLDSARAFAGEAVVVSEKMDGESTTLYRDYLHARSLGAMHHPSQTRVKQFHAMIAHDIPDRWRVVVENCSALHTVAYPDLETLFPVIGIWTDRNVCLSWDDTLEWCALLGLPTVPVLYRGPWDEARVRACYTPMRGAHRMEGYVVRVARAFTYGAYRTSVAKYVDAAFKTALEARDGHWQSKPVEWNRVRTADEAPR